MYPEPWVAPHDHTAVELFANVAAVQADTVPVFHSAARQTSEQIRKLRLIRNKYLGQDQIKQNQSTNSSFQVPGAEVMIYGSKP